MSEIGILYMYSRFAHTAVETTFLVKHGNETVIGMKCTVAAYWADLDNKYETMDVLQLLQL